MTLGPVMVDLQGTALTESERRRLLRPEVGGVLLFTRNYESPEQIRALVSEIHALRDPHLLVAVDHEGGRVQRFRDGFTRLPPVAELGLVHDRDPREAETLAEMSGWLMAIELRAVGVDLSFAPVLDIGRDLCPVIGDRAFHRDPEVIARLAGAYQRGMKRAGMAAVGKHFPGHGGVCEDSHLALPCDTRSLADLQLEDLVPFERLIHQGLPGMMIAHVRYSAINDRLAGFSPFWLREYLRGELGFQGAIFSDDLSMVAAEAAGDVPLRAHAALEAGCDMVLVCNAPDDADAAIDRLRGHADPAAQLRLTRLHGRQPAPEWDALHRDPAWIEARDRVRGYDQEPLLDMDM